jgi:hypothetical protein
MMISTRSLFFIDYWKRYMLTTLRCQPQPVRHSSDCKYAIDVYPSLLSYIVVSHPDILSIPFPITSIDILLIVQMTEKPCT